MTEMIEGYASGGRSGTARPRPGGAAPRRREFHPPRREAAQGGYRRSREHGMVIVRCPHVQVVISPLVLCSQAVSMRSATGFQ